MVTYIRVLGTVEKNCPHSDTSTVTLTSTVRSELEGRRGAQRLEPFSFLFLPVSLCCLGWYFEVSLAVLGTR